MRGVSGLRPMAITPLASARRGWYRLTHTTRLRAFSPGGSLGGPAVRALDSFLGVPQLAGGAPQLVGLTGYDLYPPPSMILVALVRIIPAGLPPAHHPIPVPSSPR